MAKPIDLELFSLSQLRQRSSTKWSRDSGELIAAWIADMDFPVAEPIIDALRDFIDRGDIGYVGSELDENVRIAFVNRMFERYSLELEPSHVVAATNVVQGIFLSLLTLTEQDDAVVFLTPTYPPFFSVVEQAKRRIVTFDLVLGDHGFEIDFDGLRQVIREQRVRCLLLCSPQNPTGRVFRVDELEVFARIVEEFDLVVISDEIHADLTLPGASHRSFATISKEIAERTVTLSSASKAFNVASLRCAFLAFGSTQHLEKFNALGDYGRGSVGATGMIAALAAFTSGDPWLDSVISYLDGNRTIVAEYLAPLSTIRWYPPEATFLAWLDLSETALMPNPAVELALRAGLALSPGEDFGSPGSGHVRLNFATPRPVLHEILQRLSAAVLEN